VQIRLRNLVTGAVAEAIYDSEDELQDVTLERVKAELLYESSDTFTFMDLETYEQIDLPSEEIGDLKRFLKEGQKVDLQRYETRYVGITLPLLVRLTVTETEPGVK
jgi:elongation factor P